MAYSTRPRDPLFDAETRALIEKRGQELIGFGLLTMGLVLALILFSHSPEDATFWRDQEASSFSNWFGAFGARISELSMWIIGIASWGMVLVFFVWGLRLVFHYGAERIAERLIFTPLFIAAASVYAACLVPADAWLESRNYAFGGIFGDTILAVLINMTPLSPGGAIRIWSVLSLFAMLASGAFVLGFVMREIRDGFQRAALGIVLAYAWLVAQGRKDVMPLGTERKPADGTGSDVPAMPRAPRIAIPNPVPIEDRVMEPIEEEDKPSELSSIERIRSRIGAAIAARRGRSGEDLESSADEAALIEEKYPLTKGRGHGPVPLILPEPPLARREPLLTGEDETSLKEETLPVQAELEVEIGREEVVPSSIPRFSPERLIKAPPTRPIAPSPKAAAEAQPKLALEVEAREAWSPPPLALLENPDSVERLHLSEDALEANARMLESVLDDYGVKGEIVTVRPGPVVTMYELEPAPGLKASRVIGLADDIARSMSALSARVSTVPGRSVIGIELPNEKREKVVLREMLASREFDDRKQKLPLALGKDIGGEPIIANLAKMPHLLIAGTTGSGKSVAINTMILSLLYRLSPEECRLIMIDPKMLELSVYDGIPHLLSPVVTDPKKALVALKWVVAEMEERYRKMSKMGVRNIDGYNGRVDEALKEGRLFARTVQTGFDDETGEPVFETEEFAPERMPYIVVIVDEMADLMMVAGKEIEACIQRLAQMARASGIHLIMATQRPSVDVITGTIKANFPTRISFQVTSKIDSRTILGEQGAEQLLGMGDMLYMAGGGRITRCHGPFVSDEEVEEIVQHLKAWGPPEYISGVVEGPDEEKESEIDQVLGLGGNTNGEDALYDQAVAIVLKDRKCSTSYIQRKLGIGYNKAARLVEQMEDEGLVSASNHVGKREILVPEQ